MFVPLPSHVPRARVDPIRNDTYAREVLAIARSVPATDETIAIVLDHADRGRSVLRVSGTTDPDDVFGVVDQIAELAAFEPELASIVLASVRPRRPVEPADLDRWLEASARCDDAGIDLIEWYVFSDDEIDCPRDRLGERPRWHC
jgi:hypothetical protein